MKKCVIWAGKLSQFNYGIKMKAIEEHAYNLCINLTHKHNIVIYSFYIFFVVKNSWGDNGYFYVRRG